ncbi:MAG: acetyl-CoA carboxylase biotin carboxyl carrier protein [Cyanobacteriota bacterium]|nr:acetyl-CoA carboxylase biotin carboxyl carrier protein [Cyanobacteriota bacterium]
MDAADWKEIQQLVTTLEQTSVVELTLEIKEFRLAIRRDSGAVRDPLPMPVPPPVVSVTPTPPPVEAASVPPTRKPAAPPTHWMEVTAPMVGTFYSAPAPGEPDFVKVGDRVQKGQTLCIIEAMKLMNELEAETSGRITEILVTNSQSVEFGQPLIRIDPTG